MTRAQLLELLTIERHAPGPRPVRTSAHCDPPAPITAEQAARNQQVLADAIGADLHVIQWQESA